MTKEQAKKEIEKLVQRFEFHIAEYKNCDYNKTQTRRDFIDPFFKALGWDIDNEQDYAEAYREVIHEDKIKVAGATKAPDYSFRIGGGKRLFFVEAKKPSVLIKDDIHPAYQIRRYGWNAKLAISIITDFEEFAIYDCTKKPNPKDKATVARIEYFTFRDYLPKFDFIWETFSKEHVLKGSFDKFIQSAADKKGTTTVDKEFLLSLDKWRTYLATSVSWNNKDLNEDEINFAVQQTIDRIIFLRIAEGRNVEMYGNLKTAIKQGDYYQNLFKIFREADDRYNSGIFDFKKDKISKDLKIENKVIKTILNELYPPESPYEFSVLSVEILGSAYEQFLGKTISISKSHHAKIEEKPEVRKAGGVYYTPEYIVDYIVKNTVGKLIDGKTSKEISKIKIVDPACGSGSFLIGAYQYLLDYHKNYYSNNGKPSKAKKDIVLTPEGNLTTAEKKRILLNNIFGVDIDVNAVEVTKLSLLLKCMEGETNASINYQFKLFNERALPTLDDNIKCGNSLVDEDFYGNDLFKQEKKINPFNWQKAFPEVFKQKIIEQEEGLNIYHVTCVMHNTRKSRRMIDYKVKVGQPEYLEPLEESKLIEILVNIIRDDNLKILTLNICADHLHFVLVCLPQLLTAIVGKMKSVSAKEFNTWRGITISTRGHAPLSNRGVTQNSFWAQKFHRKEIESEQQLKNVLEYIQNNRIKHNLPELSQESQNRIQSIITSYEDAFKPSMQNGGFDIVIGNPPYGALFNEHELKYFKNHYQTAVWRVESYMMFIEQAMKLLKPQGLLGYIIPDTLLNLGFTQPTRELLLRNSKLQEIVGLPSNVFAGATVDTIIVLTEKVGYNIKFNLSNVSVKTFAKKQIIQSIANPQKEFYVKTKDWFEQNAFNLQTDNSEKQLLIKIEKEKVTIQEIAELYSGIKVYSIGRGVPIQTEEIKNSKPYTSDIKINNNWSPFFDGKHIGRYNTYWDNNNWILYGKNLAEPRSQKNFIGEKILIRKITGKTLIANYVANDSYCNTLLHVLKLKINQYYYKPILGILNSQLIGWYFRKKFQINDDDTFPQIMIRDILQFPIPKIEKENNTELHKLVDQIIQLNNEKTEAKLQTKIEQLKGKIDYCETRINEIVYKLYGLEKPEIEIIKGI